MVSDVVRVMCYGTRTTALIAPLSSIFRDVFFYYISNENCCDMVNNKINKSQVIYWQGDSVINKYCPSV